MSGSARQRLDGGQDADALDADAALQLYEEAMLDPTKLRRAASSIRDSTKGKIVSFSKKVFVSVTTLCRDTCTYCTYKTGPRGEAFMPIDRVDRLLRNARKRGCVEALFVAGEHPEERYDEAVAWLARYGMSGTAEYIARCSELAIEHGMFPHTNAGNLAPRELALLSKTNSSVGLMLESSSDRLGEQMMPHHDAPSKTPRERIRALENAASAKIPTTTGILVGIGETAQEAIESLVAINEVNRRHGHIQEVIIQNFQPKLDTAMRSHPAANEAHFSAIVALARLMMPEMNIQVPPNLSPESYYTLLGSGINDWGGISPVTPDYVNPEFAWPRIHDVESRTRCAGFKFRCRFPTYPEYLDWMPRRLREMASECGDASGYVADTRWRCRR